MYLQDSLLFRILQMTAWRMEAPHMYGVFHIAAVIIVVIAAIAGAAAVSRRKSSVIRTLAVTGWVLAAMELYKQLFLCFIVNGGAYDWWDFPFQLCSVPMYMCILLPVLEHGRDYSSQTIAANRTNPVFSAILTFLATYTFVGAAAALAVPEDFMRSYVSLTLHGFIWHGILLFICLTVVFSGIADLSWRGFRRATMLFLGLCVIAVVINVLAEPVMASAHAAGLVPNQYAAMFYLNPFHLSPQPVVGTVQKSAGIPVGLALYVLTIILSAGLVCAVFHSRSAAYKR